MGYTAQTPENVVIGAGDLLIGPIGGPVVDIGATADDNVARIDENIFEPDNINGVPGMLVGLQYIVSQHMIIESGMPEVSEETLAVLWPGSEETTGTIDWDATRRIPLTSFHDIELRVPGLVNLFTWVADNAINLGSPEWTGANAGMMNPRAEFHSRWSATPGARSPHRILIAALGS
jgi:hypothetical protein